MDNLHWLKWVRSLQTIAQAGLTYTQNPFDLERYHQIQGLAAEMLSGGMPEYQETAQQLLQAERGYATPKLDARGVVFQDGQIMLVKELSDGCWTLPGGWVDLNEPPSLAVEREVWEESGYRVKAVKLLGVYDRDTRKFPPLVYPCYKLFIACDLLGGESMTSIETGGAEFFSSDQLPPLSLPRVSPELVLRMFAHHEHPEWPADFD